MIFIDTNILFYAVDSRDPVKQRRAADVLLGVAEDSTGVISSQVLVEFAANLVRKLGHSPSEAADRLRMLSDMECVSIDVALAAHAMELAGRYQLSTFDSFIAAAAVRSGCRYLFTEDLQHGMVIDDLRIVNPFRG